MPARDEGTPARSRLARTARLAALPAAYAGRTALGLGKRLGGRPAELFAEQVQQRTAEQLFATLGHLKGGAMKMGQALSAMEAALPEQLAGPYRETLIKLQEAAPLMPAVRVHEQLEASFGPHWRERFGDSDDRPAAAASIGQVHRATWSDGTPVAVKVQCPGAAEALVADLDMLQGLSPILKAAAPHLDVRQLFTELRARFVEEVDYAREAEAQTAFADAYRGDPDVLVPEVLAVEGEVLVTEWIDGTPLSRVIASGTQADRNRCGTALVHLFTSGPARARRLHGDPHPGNFRLMDDGRLGVLDFGSNQPMPRGWPPRFGPLLAAGRDDAAELHRIAASAQLLRPDDVTLAALLGPLNPYLQPLRSPEYQFTRSWLQEQTRRDSDLLGAAQRIQRKLTIPPHYLLLQRVAEELVGVLCSLNATVAVDGELRRWLPGY
ncbi:ABC1 kinase family protein [Blastococcus sp. SYSU DS0539]